jgi:hypothetical protein
MIITLSLAVKRDFFYQSFPDALQLKQPTNICFPSCDLATKAVPTQQLGRSACQNLLVVINNCKLAFMVFDL